MQLKTVVLPAPFGPISALMPPRSTSKVRLSTATRPPKRIVRCSTLSMISRAVSAMTLAHEVGGDRLALFQERGGRARGNETAWPPDHDQHHGEAEQQHPVLRRIEGRAEDGFKEIELAHDLGAA